MTIFYICLLIYVISYFACEWQLNWMKKNIQSFNSDIENPITEKGTKIVPYIPIINTWLTLSFMLDFIKCGFNWDKLKNKGEKL